MEGLNWGRAGVPPHRSVRGVRAACVSAGLEMHERIVYFQPGGHRPVRRTSAAEAGVGKATLFRRFGDKAGLAVTR